MTKKTGGWFKESRRHSLAARGVETGKKTTHRSRASRVHSKIDPERNKRTTTRAIAVIHNTDLDTARKIFDWIRKNRPDRLYEKGESFSDYGNVQMPEEQDVMDACDALGIPRYERKLIAGRGEVGDMNWGVDFKGVPDSILDRWERNLKKHIGEEVYLSGGGGYGSELVKLVGVKKDVWDKGTGKMGLRAELQRLETKPLQYKKGEIFDPWMDSWQVSVLEQVNADISPSAEVARVQIKSEGGESSDIFEVEGMDE
jgi:hypothetical protein